MTTKCIIIKLPITVGLIQNKNTCPRVYACSNRCWTLDKFNTSLCDCHNVNLVSILLCDYKMHHCKITGILLPCKTKSKNRTSLEWLYLKLAHQLSPHLVVPRRVDGHHCPRAEGVRAPDTICNNMRIVSLTALRYNTADNIVRLGNG